MILLKNVTIASSSCTEPTDILLDDKILEIGKNLDFHCRNLEIMNGGGRKVIPGYLDQHVHITGGGGEAGFSSRVPEITLSDCIKAGVTTVVGLLGTDAATRRVENLVAKAKELNEYGLTAFCLTGAYEYPSPTLTGSVKKDIVFIGEVIGVKIAISDHRSSNMSKADLVRLASEARVAGLIARKPGIVHMHVGSGKSGLSMVFDILETEDIPIRVFRPTHVGRIFDEAVRFARLGGYIDFTAGEDAGQVAGQLVKAFDQAPADRITLSTDANGSVPRWSETHEMIGMGIGQITALHDTIKALVCDCGVPLADAIRVSTENVARALNLYPRKGCIREGSDADILLLDDDYTIDTVISGGIVMMRNKIIRKKGNFE